MTIWILAIVWLGIAVSSAYVQGAIRACFSLVGIVAGLFLAMPLSSAVVPILPYVAITNPWWQALIAPVVAFFAVGVVFKVVGAFVHRKVEFLFKYRLTDAERTLWERMNHRVGAALGTVGGCIYFMATCLLISVIGYFTIQVGASQSEQTTLKVFSKMGEDVVSTHMDKVVGGFNPVPASFMDWGDFCGFLIQNRDVVKRLTNYPPFYALSADHYLEGDPARQNQKSPAQLILDNAQYLKMLSSETDPSVILDHDLTRMIFTNSEAKAWIEALDIKDLQEYLSTGRSPRYAGEKILGKWTFDWPASLMLAKKENPDQLASEMIMYRKEVPERFEGAVLTAALDKVLTIRINSRLEGTKLPSLTNLPPRTSYTGQWRPSGGGYTLDLRTKAGEKVNTTEAVVRRETFSRPGRGDVPVDRLYFKIENKTVCFDRVPE